MYVCDLKIILQYRVTLWIWFWCKFLIAIGDICKICCHASEIVWPNGAFVADDLSHSVPPDIITLGCTTCRLRNCISDIYVAVLVSSLLDPKVHKSFLYLSFYVYMLTNSRSFFHTQYVVNINLPFNNVLKLYRTN